MSASDVSLDKKLSTGRRKHSAPPGNRTARKHRLYSPRFRPAEMDRLEQTAAGLQGEIDLLRVVQLRLFALAGDFDQAGPGEAGAIDIETAIKLLNALSAASMRIATLMRTQSLLAGDDHETLDAFSSAIKSVTREFGW